MNPEKRYFSAQSSRLDDPEYLLMEKIKLVQELIQKYNTSEDRKINGIEIAVESNVFFACISQNPDDKKIKIEISEHSLREDESLLRSLVLHEIGHAQNSHHKLTGKLNKHRDPKHEIEADIFCKSIQGTAQTLTFLNFLKTINDKDSKEINKRIKAINNDK